jgi:hypothetical protein
MSEGPSAGQILIGIFLILFGLCIALVGGGCTIMWIAFIGSEQSGLGILLFLASLAALVLGLVVIWAGTKMFRS